MRAVSPFQGRLFAAERELAGAQLRQSILAGAIGNAFGKSLKLESLAEIAARANWSQAAARTGTKLVVVEDPPEMPAGGRYRRGER